MKLLKKFAISLLVANFAFLGLGQANIKPVYAAEVENDKIKYDIQKKNLMLAIADSVNVESSEVYNSYISAETQKAYQSAIAEGRAAIEKGENATFDELRIATGKIQDAKLAMKRDADKVIRTAKLRQAIDNNKTKVSAAKLLLKLAPQKVAKVRGVLLNLIKDSEALIKKAEALL